MHYTAASEDDVTPPGSPHYEDREDANMAVGANGINGELDDTPVMNGEDGGEITPCASPELPEGPQVQPERVAGRDLAEEGRFAEEHTAVDDGHAEPASTDPASVVPEVAVGMDGHDEAHTQDTEKDRPRLGTTVPKQVEYLFEARSCLDHSRCVLLVETQRAHSAQLAPRQGLNVPGRIRYMRSILYDGLYLIIIPSMIGPMRPQLQEEQTQGGVGARAVRPHRSGRLPVRVPPHLHYAVPLVRYAKPS